jgi:sRNA-binding carbon storage regulator CsrA
VLLTELQKGQSVHVGDTSLKLVRVEGNKVKLAIDAPKEVEIKYEKKPFRIDNDEQT